MRKTVAALQESMIRQVANAVLGRDDVLAFWFGESDEVTPALIRDAAARSLAAGETFYSHNLGLPELRQALASYSQNLRLPEAGGITADRIAVTAGGVNALMVAMQALVDAGDRVVVLTPVWPNLTAQPQVMGADLHTVSLRPEAGRWQLDMDLLLAAVTPAARLLVLNAPNNPTGWTLSRDEQRQILDHCRRTGTWILADEVYERLYYDGQPGECAPSFLDLAEPEDRVVVVNSFSKSFLMTGWRLGWLTLPPSLVPAVGKLLEFNTSCSPVFIQRAGQVAIEHASHITPGVVAHLRRCRDTLVPLLQTVPGLELAPAPAGLYAFFRLQGQGDSLSLAKRLVQEAGLGLAPGQAFFDGNAPEMQGWLRWCFASRDLARLEEGVARLRRWLVAESGGARQGAGRSVSTLL